MVVCRTSDGDIAFLPGHAPFLGALGIAHGARSCCRTRASSAAAVHGGFVEVSNDHVIVLTDVAELPEQIDVVRAQTAKARAVRTSRRRGRRGGPGRPRPRRAPARGRVRSLIHGIGFTPTGDCIFDGWRSSIADPVRPARAGRWLPSADGRRGPLRRRGDGGGLRTRPTARPSPPHGPARGMAPAGTDRCAVASTSAAARAHRPRRSRGLRGVTSSASTRTHRWSRGPSDRRCGRRLRRRRGRGAARRRAVRSTCSRPRDR